MTTAPLLGRTRLLCFIARTFTLALLVALGRGYSQPVPRVFLGPAVTYPLVGFGTGSLGTYTAAADVKGDGFPDVITASANAISVLLGRQDGTLGPRTDVAAGVVFSGLAVSDLNSDGKPDIVVIDNVGNTSTNHLAILFGDGKGGFSSGGSLPAPCPVSVAVADLNRDGRPDILVSQGCGIQSVLVFLGTGSGRFGTATTFPSYGASGNPIARTASSIATADFNHDGNPDVVLANTETGYITIQIGDGKGGLSLYQRTTIGLTHPLSLTVGDFDKDGYPDVAVSFLEGQSISVFFGDSSGSIFNRPRVDLASIGLYSPSLATADFDGDGNLDLAITNTAGNDSGDLGVSLFTGDGRGGFKRRIDFKTTVQSVYSLSVGDLNGDRRPELIFGGDTVVGFFANTTAAHHSWIDAVQNSASSIVGPVSPGEIITIYGQGIGPDKLVGLQLDPSGLVGTSRSGAQVLFDGVPAPIVYAQANQVSAIVPYSPHPRPYGTNGTVIEIAYLGEKSNPLLLTTAQSAPGIFTLDSTGVGQGAILNQDFSINSPSNPAQRGSILSLYATGEGQTAPQGVDGKLADAPLPKPLLPVLVTIGGISTEVLYAGGAPGLVAGVMQVNARVPANTSPGNNVAISVTVGSNLAQSGVTIAVK
jgi:uncharacterized protein (TIGR03437 family)